jgi:hypothetical protein
MSSEDRKAAGEYFTPARVMKHIIRETLLPLLGRHVVRQPLRVLEPACGDGGFLAECYQFLLDWHRVGYVRSIAERRGTLGDASHLERSPDGRWRLKYAERRRILLASCFGVELNPELVDITRRRLAELAAEPQETEALIESLRSNIRCGDALIGTDFPAAEAAACGVRPFSWEQAFGEILNGPQGGFDAVIGNPPYVNMRVLTRSRGSAVKEYLEQHYQCARHAYDLYVLFQEKAFQLLRPGGMCGLIVPNKIATLRYAQPCRSLLLQHTTIRRITDVSQGHVFPEAGVYPYIVIWQKSRPWPNHVVQVYHVESIKDLRRTTPAFAVKQADLSAETGFWLHGGIDVESRVPTRRLDQVARLHSGTMGFDASALASALVDRSERPEAGGFRFIVSGNIDRYAIRSEPVRFMNRDFLQPVLPPDSPLLTQGKRELYRQGKIVIAGMTRRLEAAWDPGGLALGVQVYAASGLQEDRRYVLALLNSKLLSSLFRARFRGQQFAGSFLAINKGQIGQLPIRIVEPGEAADWTIRQRLLELAEAMERAADRLAGESPAGGRRALAEFQAADEEIDQLVYRLYRLTEAEIGLAVHSG